MPHIIIEMQNTEKNNTHPVYLKLAKMFSSVKVMGPPISEKLVAIISHMFNPEEAHICTHMSFIHPKTAAQIARNSGYHPDDLAPVLKNMSQKRIIITAGNRYMLYPLIPGAFEYILMTGKDSEWHNKYAELINELYDTEYMDVYFTRPVNAIRNIPIQHIIENKSFIANTDLISELIDSHTYFAVLNRCPCRQSMHLTGHECRRAAPEDGCLIFGDYSRGIVENGTGRHVDKEEMRDIVADRWEKKLVFLTSNVLPSAPTAVCTCCDCCCHGLGIHNNLSKNLIAPSHFIAHVDESLCNNCGRCVEACNTQAHYLIDKKHVYIPENCVGCGNCVVACKSSAIRLIKNNLYRPPYKNYIRLILSMMPAILLMGVAIKFKRYFNKSKT